MQRLLATSKRTLDLLVLLLKPHLALLRHRVLVAVRGVVARERVDGCVQRRERRHARHLGLAAVESDKVVHLRAGRLDNGLHVGGAARQLGGKLHVLEQGASICRVILLQLVVILSK